MSSGIQTTITNTSGQRRRFAYLPPNGQTLDDGEIVVFEGELVTILYLSNTQGLDQFLADQLAGLITSDTSGVSGTASGTTNATTAEVDLLTADIFTVATPAGKLFIPFSVGIVVTSISGGSIVDQLEIQLGTSLDADKYLAPSFTSQLVDAFSTDGFQTLLSTDAVDGDLLIEITTPITGPTTLLGKLYVSGTII